MIGRYDRLEPIGRGAMGIVYRAHDPLIHRTVAVKVLHAPKGLDPQQFFVARERFRREAQAAGGIDHPHIVRIFDVGEDEATGELYIVMEYLAGSSLESRISRADLDLDTSVAIIGQIASGLDAAHEREIVHRDVKPSNVLFSERGAAKIVDFGITQVASSSLTQDMSKLGTPAYMSPEQVNGKPIDRRADLFSLGVLAYEILTGKKPFAGSDLVSIAYAITHTEPIPVSGANPILPQSLDRVFSLMMAKDPADRFASGTAFHEAIVRCLREDAMARQPALVRGAPLRKRALWGLAGAAALAAAVLSVVLGRAPAEPAATGTTTAAAPPLPAPVPPKPAVVTTKATFSLTHRIRQGTLVVSLDGVAIFREEFSKAKMAISQTTTWDPVKVSAGKHTLKAKVIGADGRTYQSDVYAVQLPRSPAATFRIRFKDGKLVVQQG
jgi:serine/threonine-protein kinase